MFRRGGYQNPSLMDQPYFSSFRNLEPLPPPAEDFLLLEDGFFLLQENNGKIIL